MPGYVADGFRPPAAVVRALLRGPSGTSSAEVELLIDSGADVSVVPVAAAAAVGAAIRPSGVPIRLLAGGDVLLDQAELSVEFLRYRFRGAFLVVDSSYGILGRNVLNALALTLDGPRLEWSVVDEG